MAAETSALLSRRMVRGCGSTAAAQVAAPLPLPLASGAEMDRDSGRADAAAEAATMAEEAAAVVLEPISCARLSCGCARLTSGEGPRGIALTALLSVCGVCGAAFGAFACLVGERSISSSGRLCEFVLRRPLSALACETLLLGALACTCVRRPPRWPAPAVDCAALALVPALVPLLLAVFEGPRTDAGAGEMCSAGIARATAAPPLEPWR
jgi:hypothetical protein